MVEADIWENPLAPDDGAALAEGLELFARSNGLAEGWPKPVTGAEEDCDEVSDRRASSAEAAAPIAGNMAELRQMPQWCGR
jgi:hypothetical protein